MRLLEHESKKILKRYGVDIPRGITVESEDERIDLEGPLMLKAQIPLGGRGKSGGVLEAAGSNEARAIISSLLKNKVRGYGAKRILVEQKVPVKQEYFMAVTYDTVEKEPVAIFTLEGGVDVEELAQEQPEKV
jgi:succinyl-CoA synthetase beta subunit